MQKHWFVLLIFVAMAHLVSADAINTNQINFAPTLNRTHYQTITTDELSNISVELNSEFVLLNSGGGALVGNNLSWNNVSNVNFTLESPSGCTEGDVYRMSVNINQNFFNFFTFICIPDSKIVDYKAEYGHGDSNYMDDNYRYLPDSDVSLFNLIRVFTYGSYFNPNEEGLNATIQCEFPNFLVMTRQKNQGTDIYHDNNIVNATFHWTNLFGNWFRVAPLEQEITGLSVGDTYNVTCSELTYQYTTGTIRANFEPVSFEVRSKTPLTVSATADNSSKDKSLTYIITNDEKYPIYNVEFLFKTNENDAHYENIKTLDVNETISFKVFLEGTGNITLDASFVPVWQHLSLKPTRYTQLYEDSFAFGSGDAKIDRILGDENITAIVGNIQEIADEVLKPSIEVFGTYYQIGDNGRVFASITQSDLYINNASCKLNINYPDSVDYQNSFFVEDGYMTPTGQDGLYYYDMVVPAPVGIYMVVVTCEVGGEDVLVSPYSENLINGSSIFGVLLDTQNDDETYYITQDVNGSYSHEFLFNLTTPSSVASFDSVMLNIRGYNYNSNGNITMYLYNYSSNAYQSVPNEIYTQTIMNDITTSYKVPASADYFDNYILKAKLLGTDVTLYLNKVEAGFSIMPDTYTYKTAGGELNVRTNLLDIQNNLTEIHNQIINLNTTGGSGTSSVGLATLTNVERVIGSQQYSTELTIYDDQWNWVSDDEFPQIIIRDPNGLIIANTSMYFTGGVYKYYVTIEYGTVGLYTTEVHTTVGGQEILLFDKWTLISNPTEVTVDVNSVCDNDNIVCADITITNEGYEDFEYFYYWWTSDEPFGDYEDASSIDRGQASKLLRPRESYTREVCLQAPRTDGTHYFRAKTYYGDYSFASDQFTSEKLNCDGTFMEGVTGMTVLGGGGGTYIQASVFILLLLFVSFLIWLFRNKKKAIVPITQNEGIIKRQYNEGVIRKERRGGVISKGNQGGIIRDNNLFDDSTW